MQESCQDSVEMPAVGNHNVIQPSAPSALGERKMAGLPAMACYNMSTNPSVRLTRSSSAESNQSASKTTPMFIGTPIEGSDTDVIEVRVKTKGTLRLSFLGPPELHSRQREESANSDLYDTRSSHHSLDEVSDRSDSADEFQTGEDEKPDTQTPKCISQDDPSPTLEIQTTFGRNQQTSGLLNLDNPQRTLMAVRSHCILTAKTRTSRETPVLAARRHSFDQDDTFGSIGNVLDLFPLPKSVTLDEVTTQPRADTSFRNWLKFVEARADARQAMIRRKQVQLDLRSPPLGTTLEGTSFNWGQKTSSDTKVELDSLSQIYERPQPITIDFSGFNWPARAVLIPKETRALDSLKPSVCSLVSSDGVTALCQDALFTAQEARTERKLMLERADVMAAQRCIVKDEHGTKRSFKSLINRRRTVVIFIRFFWCALCQTYVKRLSKLFKPGGEFQRSLDNNDTRIVIVGTGNWKMISGYRAMLECPFEIFTDFSADKELFQKMALNRTLASGKNKDRAEYLSEMNMKKNVIQSIKSIGKMPLRNPGRFSQLGGEFCFENSSQKHEEVLDPTVIQKPPTLRTEKTLVHGLQKFSRHLFDDPDFASASPALTLESDSEPIADCIYANRMTTTRNHGDLKLLFDSIGINLNSDSPEKD